MFAVAALLLASGAVCAGVPGWLAAHRGNHSARRGRLCRRRICERPSCPGRAAAHCARARGAADHPWPNDPVPLQARGVERPPVMSLTLPAIGSVVELNQN